MPEIDEDSNLGQSTGRQTVLHYLLGLVMEKMLVFAIFLRTGPLAFSEVGARDY